MAVVAGVLLLALVYFAVGQAAALRNGAQTAADAAALAAAQDVRDQLRQGWLDVIDDPVQWRRFLQGEAYAVEQACQGAATFAAANDAELLRENCVPLDLGFTVTVQSKGTVGESIVPGTSERQATASATAVVEPLCMFNPPESSTGPSVDPDPSRTPPEGPAEEDPEPISGLFCDGEEWEIDLENPVLPDADDLFRVRLTGDDE